MMGRYSLIMYALRAHASPASAYCPSDETAYSFDPPDIKDKFNIRKGSVFEWVAVGVQTELERNDAERPGVPQTGSKTKLEIGSTEIAEAGDCRYETISITRKMSAA